MNKNLKQTGGIVVFSLLLLSLMLIGCSKRYQDLPAFSSWPIQDAHNNSVGRFKTSYLAEQIHAYFRGNSAGPIAVTTFVDIDNLYSSSTFGRLVAEQLMSELAMLGYNVVEVRQSEAMQIMANEGEFGLSREVQVLRGSQEVAGLVVGTYVASPERVYLNARLIDPASSLVISAGSVEMEKTPELARLLRTSFYPAAMERVPVRQIDWEGASSYGRPSRFNEGFQHESGNSANMPIPPAKNSAPSPHLEIGS